MRPSVSALLLQPSPASADLIEELAANSSVAHILLINGEKSRPPVPPLYPSAKLSALQVDSPLGSGIMQALDKVTSDYMLVVMPGERVKLGSRTVERLLDAAEDSGAGLIYSDFRDEVEEELIDHPLIDYRLGSIRDTFDFGSMVLISKPAAEAAFVAHGPIDQDIRFGGLYDLRLKLSIDSAILRVPEPLYTRVPSDRRATGDRQFDYVDPHQRGYQIEMETVATAHLKRIGAYLSPEFHSRKASEVPFPVYASIVIPVRNRERTIKDAVLSALSQQTPFSFNVIVVDNHSSDATGVILASLARLDHKLVNVIPQRRDLGIGGCWNEAIYSEKCGEFAVQLDSDDLYKDEHTLNRIVAKFDEAPYAMIIGAYTIVNFDLREIPPGLIDHTEWTRENGRNNALRINGLGAPRAFHVPTLREIGLPNTSYGEDYSTALRISRHYEIGRLYESLYFARRWEGNSDAALSISTANRYDSYKDHSARSK